MYVKKMHYLLPHEIFHSQIKNSACYSIHLFKMFMLNCIESLLCIRVHGCGLSSPLPEAVPHIYQHRPLNETVFE